MKLQYLAMAVAMGVAALPASMVQADSANRVTKVSRPELGPEYKMIRTFTDFRKKLIADGWVPVPDPECHDAVLGGYYDEYCGENPTSMSCRLCTILPELFRSTSDGYMLTRYVKDGVPLSVTVYGDTQDLDAPGQYGLVVVGWNYSDSLNVILLD